MIEHPDITKALRTGYPYDEPECPCCPMCGAETDTFLKNEEGEIVGCEECIYRVDAWDEMERIKDAWEDIGED